MREGRFISEFPFVQIEKDSNEAKKVATKIFAIADDEKSNYFICKFLGIVALLQL